MNDEKSKKTKAELKHEQSAKQIALIKKWPKRLKALASRKEDPLTEGKFCERHGFDPVYFNRMKRLEFVPKTEKTGPVEKAFSEEGV